MKSVSLSALVFLLFNIISCYAQSSSVFGRIYPNTVLPEVGKLSYNTEIVLNSGEYITYLKPDHTFEFKNVKPGLYLAQINTKDYAFDKFWVLVQPNGVLAAKEVPEIEFSLEFLEDNKCEYPLAVQALYQKDYFEPRTTFNVLGFFKNPIVLLMCVSIGMMYILPRLANGLDEEELKEIKKSQGNMQDFMNKAQGGDFSQMFSKFLADAQMNQAKAQKRK